MILVQYSFLSNTLHGYWKVLETQDDFQFSSQAIRNIIDPGARSSYKMYSILSCLFQCTNFKF